MVRVRVFRYELSCRQAVPSLDTRGYCTRFTLCAYFTTPPYNSYRVTLPPSNYPSTAPYASLSAHFAKLVKNGTLRPQVVKLLLYAQQRKNVDWRAIRLREKKRQRSTAKILNNKKRCDSNTAERGSSSVSTERSELERQDAFEFPTDSESEDSICGEINFSEDEDEVYDDCLSNPFEYVQIQRELRNSKYNSTDTFVDHGKQRKSSAINFLRLSTNPSEDAGKLKKESLIIGSKALQALARKSSTCSIVHTTSAQLRLGADGRVEQANDSSKLNVIPQQTSANSDGSSVYDARGLNGVYLACEDLANLESEANCKKSECPASPTERHSMPNIFVGNRFNHSPNTAVYVPSWKDRHENQNQSVEIVKTKDDEGELHSSSLDLPASCRAAPDQMQAELLYNFHGSLSELTENDIVTAPTMFKQLKKNQVASNAAAYNNDKREESQTSRSSIKRCISFQYIEMNNAQAQHDGPNNRQQPHTRKDKHMPEGKCKCCDGSQCPSPRSSDSGMAGSCTIASPDPPNTDAAYYYGGVVRLQLEKEQSAAEHYDVCGTFREKFLSSETVQKPTKNPISLRVQARSVLRQPKETSETTTAQAPAGNMSFSSTSNSAENGMFRSGMYAHWWKKEQLPDAVVRGIAVVTKALPLSKQSSQESHCSICSSCHCSFSFTGFSEGANYCALCQDCATSASLEQAVHTNTTNTSSFSCPLCSAENTELSEHLNQGVVTTSSTSSSVECPICAKNRDSHLRRENSFDCVDATANTPVAGKLCVFNSL